MLEISRSMHGDTGRCDFFRCYPPSCRLFGDRNGVSLKHHQRRGAGRLSADMKNCP